MNDRYNNSSNAYRYEQYDFSKDLKSRIKEDNVEFRKTQNTTLPFKVILKTIITFFCLVILCVWYIGLLTGNTQLKNNIYKKQKEYSKLVRNNDDLENTITKTINTSQIKQKAKKLGMRLAKSNDIKYYKIKSEEFVIQIEDFPQ